jgi:transcriptional enhancer factor
MANPSSLSDFVRMSAVDDLSYPLACDDRTRDAVNTIVSGRKSWKTLKGKGEAVWPPYLEAALIEGPPHPYSTSLAHPLIPSFAALDKYRPETSRSTRSLSRFPNRNRFISDYIYHVTGKRRTAKQVGSRLQQLRDTCGGKRSQCFSQHSSRLFVLTDKCPLHSSQAAF